jgi:hypothetical protein
VTAFLPREFEAAALGGAHQFLRFSGHGRR